MIFKIYFEKNFVLKSLLNFITLYEIIISLIIIIVFHV